MQKNSLHNQQKLGILSLADVAIEEDMIHKKQQKIIKKLVDAVHVTAKGKVRSIVHHAPTTSYPDGYVYTKIAGKKVIKSKTEAELYEKLYTHYFGKFAYTFDDVFEMALSEKKDTKNPKDNTLRRDRYEYERHFSKDFRNRDITELSDIDLQKYSQNLVNENQITDKRFLAYKGILNLIFGYALRHGLIEHNPVSSINNSVYLKSCIYCDNDSENKILTKEEIELLINEAKKRALKKYYVYYYALRFSALTGVRVGELCSLRWADINFKEREIHIHTQQLYTVKDGHYSYYEAGYTKNEKGHSKGGRLFPLTNEIKALLTEYSEVLNRENIVSEYVFCYSDGTWMNTMSYKSFLSKLCRKYDLKATSNHALRRSLNSNVLIPNGISEADRAKLLGHSVETNLRHYSYAKKDYIDNARAILDNMPNRSKEPLRNPYGTIPFKQNKSPQTANL